MDPDVVRPECNQPACFRSSLRPDYDPKLNSNGDAKEAPTGAGFEPAGEPKKEALVSLILGMPRSNYDPFQAGDVSVLFRFPRPSPERQHVIPV